MTATKIVLCDVLLLVISISFLCPFQPKRLAHCINQHYARPSVISVNSLRSPFFLPPIPLTSYFSLFFYETAQQTGSSVKKKLKQYIVQDQTTPAKISKIDGLNKGKRSPKESREDKHPLIFLTERYYIFLHTSNTV